MSLVELPRVVPDRPGRPAFPEYARPMRDLTGVIAVDPDAWTPQRATQVGGYFDELAAGWRGRDAPERHEAIHDALERGGPFPAGWCLEVGAGTGNVTRDLEARFDTVASTDLAGEMLRLSPHKGRQLRSDAAALPFPAGSAAVVALINMFLFPSEVARVLADDGVLLWVNTNGDETPIYLPAAEVLDALPGSWDGVTAHAGWGTWLTARRARA
jgi:SAM-dependent methyltransferase